MSSAKSPLSKWSPVSVAFLALAAFAISALGQEADKTSAPVGYVDDWSTHHVTFSNPGTREDAVKNGTLDKWLKITNDPRYVMQQLKRGAGAQPAVADPNLTTADPDLATETDDAMGGMAARPVAPARPRPVPKNPIKKDWSMSSGTQTGESLTLTVTCTTNCSGDVSTSSSVTISGPTGFTAQTLQGSAPTKGTQTGTFSGQPTTGTLIIANPNSSPSNSLTLTPTAAAYIEIVNEPSNHITSITVGSTNFCFRSSGTCPTGDTQLGRSGTPSTDAANLEAGINAANITGVTASLSSNGTTIILTNSTATAVTLTDGDTGNITVSGSSIPAGSIDGCTSKSAGTFLTVSTAVGSTTDLATDLAAAIASCNTAYPTVGITSTSATNQVTFTADNAGSQTETLTNTLINFALNGTSVTGTDGTTSGTSFKYTTSGAYDTQAQLAADLVTALGMNTTVTGAMTVANSPGTNQVTLTATPGATGYSATDATFGALSGTGSFSGGAASTVNPNTYPAKFSALGTNGASCSDYVVYPTGFTGSSTQASIIGYTDLYGTSGPSGTGCGSGASPTVYVPTVAFAYNTGGTAGLSPIISLDGTQVAFVEANSSGYATLVLMKPSLTSGGTISSPATDIGSAVGLGSYRACTAPCYTTITFSGSPTDSNSSPYYIYPTGSNIGNNDILYVGDDSGKMHKFTGVFNGTPAEVTTTWPATVAAVALTSPVYDPVSGNLFVNGGTGYLYQFTPGATPGTVAVSGHMECRTGGFVDSPVVDEASEWVYDFIGDGCDATPGNSYVNMFKATTALGGGTGTALSFGNASKNDTATFQYDGTFDNEYYNSYTAATGTAGNLYVCVDGEVWRIGVTGGTTPALALNTFDTPVSTVVDASACSPISEFAVINANTELSAAITTTTATSASVMSATGISSGDYILVGSEYMHITGITGTNLTVTRGALSTAAATHVIDTPVQDVADDWLFTSVKANSTVGTCTAANGCVMNFNLISTTPATPVAGITADGGASGIVIDNQSTTQVGAEQIYYTTQANQSCTGTSVTGSGTGICAIQASQSNP